MLSSFAMVAIKADAVCKLRSCKLHPFRGDPQTLKKNKAQKAGNIYEKMRVKRNR